MIGDDLDSDVGGAQACGIRGVLIKTGKYRDGILESSNTSPDARVGEYRLSNFFLSNDLKT